MFGGAQILQILINWARGKCVAVLLGTEGMGISALFTSSSNTIQKFSSLGLNLSIMKELSENADNPSSLSRIIGISMRILTATSLLGALICMIFAIPLSKMVFDDESRSWQFMLLGLAVGFGIAGTGLLSMLQGLHEVKRLSQASIVGGLVGLFVGVPLYYLFGTNGIVPAMVALSLALFCFYYFSLRRSVKREPFKFKFSEHKPVMMTILSMGVILMASDILSTIVNLAINLFVSKFGSIPDVGLYQSATSVTTQYSGMVFTAMAMDYFPRLTKAAADNKLMHSLVNRQTEIVSLIITPAACLMILTAPILIIILFTDQFQPILPLLRWMGLGIMFRALMMPMAYITFAKGNKKVFFCLEGFFCNILTLSLSCLFYYFFGLIGLGYALVLDNAICLMVYYLVNRRLYDYQLSSKAMAGIAGAIALTALCFASSWIENKTLSISLMIGVTAATAMYGIIKLRTMLRSDTQEQNN